MRWPDPGVPFLLEAAAHLRVLHLGLAFVFRAQGHFPPGLGVVEQVPVREGHLEPAAPGGALAIDAQPPRRCSFPASGSVRGAVRDAPSSGRRPGTGPAASPPRRLSRRTALVVLRERPSLFTGLLVGQFDEAFVTIGQYLGEGQDLVFREQIGDHRRPVIIPLDRVRAQDLGRPAAGAGIHRLVDQPAHFLQLRLGRPPLFGFLPAHHPGIERGQRHVGQAIHAFRRAAQAVDEIGERHPVPRHARFHRVIGDRLVAGHAEHRPIAVLDA